MRRTHVVALLLALALGLLAAGCLDGTETTATADTVVGTLPEATTASGAICRRSSSTGDATAGKAVFTSAGCGGCHTLADAGTSGNVGPNLDDAKPSTELVVTRVTKGKGAMPPFGESARRPADRGRRRVRHPVDRRLILPPSFPADVQAFACDFDRTLVGRDGLLRPRTRAAIARSQAAGIPVIVATGRMFRSIRPVPRGGGHRRAGRLLPGRRRRRPGERHVPAARADPARDGPRGGRRAWPALGHSPNCYVDDRLYVERHTEYSRMYAEFQHLPVEEVGDLAAWLERPPTKLVAVADPADVPALREALARVVRRPPLPDDVAALPPRARKPGRLEGNRHRVRRRAARHLARPRRLVRRRRERHRADRRGRRSGSPSRTRTRSCSSARTGSARARTTRVSPP